MARCIVVAMLLTLLSCSNLTLEDDSVEINSMEGGRIFSEGDTLEVEINHSTISTAKSMEVEILYIDSYTRVPSETFSLKDSVDLDIYPYAEISIDETFEDGLYTLNIKILDEDGMVLEDETNEFMVFSGTINSSVSSILPTSGVYTDSKVLFKGDLDSTAVDPYLIWSYDSKIIDQGYLSDGYNYLIWDSKDFLGFNDIKMEIYPYKFAKYTPSELYTTFSTVVSSLDKELFELDNYYSAYLFNGNYIDEKSKDASLEVFGDIVPTVKDSFYGLEIKDGRGFISNRSIIPVDDKRVESFSILLDIFHLDTSDTFIFSDTKDSLTSSLYRKGGVLYFSISRSGMELGEILVSNLEEMKATRSVISYAVRDLKTSVYSTVDNEIVDQFSFPTVELEEYDEGKFSLGSTTLRSDGSYIVDSIMVYYRDNLGANNVYLEDTASNTNSEDSNKSLASEE